MNIAVANIRFPKTREESVELALNAIEQAASAQIICFPECFIPGLRGVGHEVAAPDAAFLERAWGLIGEAAARAQVAVVLGTERVVNGGLLISALVINPDGTRAGFQDKVQIDPTEEGVYTHGSGRRLFEVGELKFGVAICHEAWRYPETVRWAATRGAHLVFVPHFSEAETGSFRPALYADAANSFHEKAALCRAAENTCYIATANYAAAGSPTTSAVVRPDGSLQCFQPYCVEGLLLAEIDITTATGFLAKRLRSYD